MAQTSFPVVEQPLTDQQWGQVTVGMGSGILSVSQLQYSLGTISNANNTLEILSGGGQGQAIVAGFYHRIDSPVTLSVPAVTSTRTYFVGLTYDPTKHGAATGPVSLTVTTSRPSGSGKVYLPLYEVTRAANQLLTDAAIVNRRIYVSPHLTVQNKESLTTEGVLTTSHVTVLDEGIDYRLNDDGSWSVVNGATVTSMTPTAFWTARSAAGGAVITRTRGGRLLASLAVTMIRKSTSFTQGTGWINHGSLLPASLRTGSVGNYFYDSGLLGGVPMDIRIDMSTGEWWMKRGVGAAFTVTPDDSVSFKFEWVV